MCAEAKTVLLDISFRQIAKEEFNAVPKKGLTNEPHRNTQKGMPRQRQQFTAQAAAETGRKNALRLFNSVSVSNGK
jgi:hypothetical protein